MGNCSTATEGVGSLPVLAAALIGACAALFVRRPGAGQARPRCGHTEPGWSWSGVPTRRWR